MNQSINLFISYSHEDAEYLNKLREYVKDGMCTDLQIWDDKAIAPGQKWDNEIKNKLGSADIILLLVSQSFLNSAYVNDVELKQALAKAKSNKCTVIPVFVRTCPLRAPLDKEITAFQGFPKSNSKKHGFLSETEEDLYTHLTDIYNGIIDTVEAIKKKKNEEEAAAAADKQKSAPQNVSTSNKIFLALSGSDKGLNMRKQFFFNAKGKKEYEDWPFEILPDVKQAPTMADVNAFSLETLTGLIGSSVYTIHVITDEQELNAGIVKKQLDAAIKRNKANQFSRSLIWLKSEDLISSLTPELRSNPIVAGVDIEKVFDVIDSFEVERKKVLSTVNAPGHRVMMIYDFAKDHTNDLRIEIKLLLEEKKVCSVRLNSPDATVEKLKNDLSKCDGAVIFYGLADSLWYMYRQAMVDEAQSIKSKAVGISEPNITTKIKSDINQNEFIMLRQDGDIKSDVDNFITKLSA